MKKLALILFGTAALGFSSLFAAPGDANCAKCCGEKCAECCGDACGDCCK